MVKVEVGSIHTVNGGGELIVTSYKSASDVDVRFLTTGFLKNTQAVHIRNGKVKDPLQPSVFGVGYLGFGRHKASSMGKKSLAYETWSGVLERCYSDSFQKRSPTYKGCSVDNRWHNFQEFANYFEVNYKDGFQLDKDLLVLGNKIYGPDTCIFIPHRVNTFLIKCKSVEGNLVGVCHKKLTNKYIALCNRGTGRQTHLGTFDTKEGAHEAWVLFKLKMALRIKEITDPLDLRIYQNMVKVIKNK